MIKIQEKWSKIYEPGGGMGLKVGKMEAAGGSGGIEITQQKQALNNFECSINSGRVHILLLGFVVYMCPLDQGGWQCHSELCPYPFDGV